MSHGNHNFMPTSSVAYRPYHGGRNDIWGSDLAVPMMQDYELVPVASMIAPASQFYQPSAPANFAGNACVVNTTPGMSA